MCEQTPLVCPECPNPLEPVGMGAAICAAAGEDSHTIWLPSCTVHAGSQIVILPGLPKARAVVQTECASCAPLKPYSVDYVTGQTGLWDGTVWVLARDLKPGMLTYNGGPDAWSVVHAEPDGERTDRMRLTYPVHDRQKKTITSWTFADAPVLVETATLPA